MKALRRLMAADRLHGWITLDHGRGLSVTGRPVLAVAAGEPLTEHDGALAFDQAAACGPAGSSLSTARRFVCRRAEHGPESLNSASSKLFHRPPARAESLRNFSDVNTCFDARDLRNSSPRKRSNRSGGVHATHAARLSFAKT
jgi:hypothetical protein